MSYKSLNYTLARKIIANCDKASRNGDSKVIRSPWGVIKMYKSSARGRFYSVSGSSVLHNGGSYRIWTLREKLLAL